MAVGDGAVLTGRQIREARVLLRWTTPRLARNAGISFDTALKAQDAQGIASVTWLDLRAIRETFERSGVEFTDSSPGVRLRKGEP